MTELAHKNKEEKQNYQKAWYDRAARNRSFVPGDKVLLLLPSESNKLMCQWQGPFKVKSKLNEVDYEIEFGGRKPVRTFHVNMLRKWNERKAAAYFAEIHDELETYSTATVIEEWRDVKVNSQLSAAQQAEIQELLKSYSDVLTSRPGCTNLIEHDVITTDEIPVRQKPYRVPQAMKEVVMKEITDMTDMGVIEPSTSPWASPIVMVKKKDKTWRFCSDYRRLNTKTVFDPHPMPRADDLVESIGQAQFISTIDLSKGYWQIPLTDRAKEKSSFTTPFSEHRYRVMPFGMKNSGATFMRLMNLVLKDADRYAASYIDDIVIYSQTFEEHITHLKDVFERLRKASLTAKPKKCSIAQTETTYLGHMIGHGQQQPEKVKISAIQNFPLPVTKKDLLSYLGLTGYYRKFVKNYASIAVPLTDMTKKLAPTTLVWDEQKLAAFQKLKHLLTSQPVLKNPNYNLPFVVQTDASERGLGAVLSQIEDNQEHPVCYISRKLLPRECNYTTV